MARLLGSEELGCGAVELAAGENAVATEFRGGLEELLVNVRSEGDDRGRRAEREKLRKERGKIETGQGEVEDDLPRRRRLKTIEENGRRIDRLKLGSRELRGARELGSKQQVAGEEEVHDD